MPLQMNTELDTWFTCANQAASTWLPMIQGGDEKKEDDDLDRIIFNISGRKFETWRSTLDRYPTTLLGSDEKDYFFDQETKEFFFDRDPELFRYILNYYRSGKLHYPRGECASSFDDELSFFGIKDDTVYECCWSEFTEKKKECIGRIEEAEHSLLEEEEEINVSQMTNREKLFMWFENPDSALIASLFYYITGFFIAVSVTSTVIETIKCDGEKTCGEAFKMVFLGIESVCVVVFTIEYTARFYAAPNRCKFVRGVLSIIDVIAILPFYVGLFITKSTISGAFVTLRVFRVFRVFKFSRHSKGLRILGYTLKSCVSELGFLSFSLSMAIIIFATVIYYVEKDKNDSFSSIPVSFWYTIVTMTTLGYGDMVPETVTGKIVGSICSLSGVLVIALPVPVIVSNFSRIYLKHQRAEKRKANQESKSQKVSNVHVCNAVDRSRAPKPKQGGLVLRKTLLSKNASLFDSRESNNQTLPHLHEMRRSELDSKMSNASPTPSYASMFISSTPQSVRGSPVLRSRSNSLPNNYLNYLQANIPFNKKRASKKQSNGKTKKKDQYRVGKGNNLVNKQKNNKSLDGSNVSNHISNDNLSTRSIALSHCSNTRLGANSRQGERDRQKVRTIQDRFGSHVVRSSDSTDFRDFKSNRTSHL